MRAFARHLCFLLICTALACVFFALRKQTSRDTPVSADDQPPARTFLQGQEEAHPAVGDTTQSTRPDRIDFNFHIRPILSDRCFICHGPDKAQVASGLQLHDPEKAFINLAEEGEPNRFALVPGSPEHSEVIARISHDNPDLRMPPVASLKKPLTEVEQHLIRQWIAEGATYKPHWAFIPPTQPTRPTIQQETWVRNAVDVFILARLEARGLSPSPEADRETLIRRLYFDLTGLPPSPAAINTFVKATEPDAYERLVERLLDDPHYGERLAMEWLDVARYADTHAIHVDMTRTSWPWRDWVIQAFNENKPYDRFIVEQLAGDLLPEATLEQQLATSFNRHHGISNEGGAIDEELRIEYAADRVRTVGTAFMGLTLNCARCHDHKYDPVTMDDYYSMMSFFNSVDGEKGLEVQNEHTAYAYRPYVEIWEAEEQKEFERNEAQLKTIQTQSQWDPNAPIPPVDSNAVTPLVWTELLAKGESPAAEGKEKKKVWDITISNKQDVRERFIDPNVSQNHSFVLTLPAQSSATNLFRIEIPKLHTLDDLRMAYAYVPAYLRQLTIEVGREVETEENKPQIQWTPQPIVWSWAPEGSRAGTVGYRQALDNDPNTLWEVSPTNRPFTLMLLLENAIPASEAAIPCRITFTFMKGGTHFPQQAEVFAAACVNGSTYMEELAPFSPLASIPPAQRSDWQNRSLVLDGLVAQGDVDKGIHQTWWQAQDRQFSLRKNLLRCMVMKEMAEPRPTYILKRGQYDLPDEARPRGRAIPAVFGTLPQDAPADRLGLAQWLVHRDNPLVSRVTVNRYWQMLFGAGLVTTVENFGAQGEMPSHPDLLDYLAVDFQENAWDLKRLLRQIVTSATYRQQASASPESRHLDPMNRLLSHYPRRRLPAEMIRDQALAASGLLVKTIGGPSVKPYQPAGLWRERAMRIHNSTGTFYRDSGPNLYRRSMYTFWKQAAPPPQMATFDAPAREVCVARRNPTNTPLQALVLQNDETYLEIARKLAERVMLDIPGDWQVTLNERLARAFRLLTGRRPTLDDMLVLQDLAQRNRLSFSQPDREDPWDIALAQYGQSPVDDRLAAVELASLSFTVSAILNLDETITQD